MDDKNFDALRLENQLCFPLYAASREVIKKYRPLLDELGITYTQYIALMVLWEEDEINVKELGKRLFLDSGTLTPVLKSLEEKRFVKRSRASYDERVLNVKITDLGLSLKEKALSIPESIVSCINLEPQEASALYSLLYKLLGELGKREK